MAQLRQQYEHFVDQNAEVIVVGPEDTDTFARHWQRQAYPFVGLPDPRHQVANLYGQEVNLLKLGRLPTLVVVDRHGRVRYQHHGHSMRDIPDNEEMLDLLRKLNEEANPPAGPEGVEATGDLREE